MKLKKSDLIIIIDSRERNPLKFDEATSKTGTLQTGDYSIYGFENEVTIERKSLPDLIGSLTSERERFMREIQRLRAYDYHSLIIEATLQDICLGKWRSKMTPSSLIGSLQAINVKYGVNIIFAGDHRQSAVMVEGLLFHYLRAKYQEIEKFQKMLKAV